MSDGIVVNLVLSIFAALMCWGLWFRAVLEEQWSPAIAYGIGFAGFVVVVILNLKGT